VYKGFHPNQVKDINPSSRATVYPRSKPTH
jgi:hypothetical protein